MSESLEIFPTKTRLGSRALLDEPYGARAKDPHPTTSTTSLPNILSLIYMYDGKKAKHMRKEVKTSELETARLLLKHAQNGINTYKVGDNLVGLKWEGSCYLYIVLQDPGGAFLDSPAKGADPIFFRSEKLIPLPGVEKYRYYDENRSFYDGKILSDSVLGRPAFRCVNYFEDEAGKELKHPRSRVYAFEIRYIPNGSQLTSVDPDGQNQGPPDSGGGIPITPTGHRQ